MFEIKAIVRLDRRELVINALHGLADLPGLTVSIVEGVGRRRRHGEAADPPDFGRITMAKIEIVVTEDRLAEVLATVERAAHTGRHGDGKVFVLKVEQAVRFRTGESGAAALR